MATRNLPNSDPSFINDKHLAKGAQWLPRIGFGVLVFLSVFGNYVAFNGGWDRLWVFDERAIYAFIGAVAWQAVLSYWQWCMLAKCGFFSVWYQIPLWLSAGPSIQTFAPVIAPRIAGMLPYEFPILLKTIISQSINVVACILFDTMAERVAVKRKVSA